MKTVISTSVEKRPSVLRLTPAQARSQAKSLLKELYAVLKESAPTVYAKMPSNELQNDPKTLKLMLNVFLKNKDSKRTRQVRQAFGYLIVAGIYTPF